MSESVAQVAVTAFAGAAVGAMAFHSVFGAFIGFVFGGTVAAFLATEGE